MMTKERIEECTAALCGCQRDEDGHPWWDCPECAGTGITFCACWKCRPTASSIHELAEADSVAIYQAGINASDQFLGQFRHPALAQETDRKALRRKIEERLRAACNGPDEEGTLAFLAGFFRLDVEF